VLQILSAHSRFAVPMTDPSKPGFVLPVAIVLAVLLGLYAGAYYATVKSIEMDFVVFPFYGASWMRDSSGRLNERLVQVFRPMHWLDRRLRPHLWEPR
jgi:hypothetical protein